MKNMKVEAPYGMLKILRESGDFYFGARRQSDLEEAQQQSY
jgi:hypothetical protein